MGPPHLPIVGDFSNLRCSAISFLGETYSPPVSQPCSFGAIFIGSMYGLFTYIR